MKSINDEDTIPYHMLAVTRDRVLTNHYHIALGCLVGKVRPWDDTCTEWIAYNDGDLMLVELKPEDVEDIRLLQAEWASRRGGI